MPGHGEKVSRKQELAIVALLAEPSLQAAAIKVGVGEGTLQRWLKRPAFARAFRDARRRLVETAIARLQQTVGEAVDALRRNLTCGVASVEVRAAVGIIEHALRAVETMDLANRVDALEDRRNEPENPPFAFGANRKAKYRVQSQWFLPGHQLSQRVPSTMMSIGTLPMPRLLLALPLEIRPEK